MACAYYYGSTMCNSMLSDTYHNNNNNTKAAVHMYRVDSSLTRVSSCLLSYEPPRYEIEVREATLLLLYDKMLSTRITRSFSQQCDQNNIHLLSLCFVLTP